MEKLTFDKNRDHAPLKDDNNGCSYVSMLSSRNHVMTDIKRL